jgi:MFS family permease
MAFPAEAPAAEDGAHPLRETASHASQSHHGDHHQAKKPKASLWRLVAVTTSLCLGIFLFGLDVNIVGVAVPHITTEFASLPDVAWYGAAYLLTLTAFQPLFGKLYQLFDGKWVYLISLGLFEGRLSLYLLPDDLVCGVIFMACPS